MTLHERIRDWGNKGLLSPEQQEGLSSLVRHERLSVFLELNTLLYLGVISFIGGLGWTINTYFQELGTVAIILGLSAILAVCLGYAFVNGKPYSPNEVQSPNLAFDYILYLGCLAWSVELGYLENRFKIAGGQWSIYLLVTAIVYLALAYRFDNRFVLSLGLSSLAGWFGIKSSFWQGSSFGGFRSMAFLYGTLMSGAGYGLAYVRIKAHFQNTYMNFAANALFWAALSGIFAARGFSLWYIVLFAISAGWAYYGSKTRQFIFVAYAAIYTYIALSTLFSRFIHEPIISMLYYMLTGAGMIVLLLILARTMGRES